MRNNVIPTFLLSLLMISETVLGQSNKTIIREYKSTKEKIVNRLTPFSMEKRLELYQSMDMLPRTAWGKVQTRILHKKEVTINNTSFIYIWKFV